MRVCNWHGFPSAEAMLNEVIAGREEFGLVEDKSSGDFVQFVTDEDGYLRCEVSLESYPGPDGKIGRVMKFSFLKPDDCIKLLERFASGQDMVSVIQGWEDIEQAPRMESWVKWLIGAVVIVAVVWICYARY